MISRNWTTGNSLSTRIRSRFQSSVPDITRVAVINFNTGLYLSNTFFSWSAAFYLFIYYAMIASILLFRFGRSHKAGTTVMLSDRRVLQSPGLYCIWKRGSNGRSVGTNVRPKSCERNSRAPPISDTSPTRIT